MAFASASPTLGSAVKSASSPKISFILALVAAPTLPMTDGFLAERRRRPSFRRSALACERYGFKLSKRRSVLLPRPADKQRLAATHG
jgi:hypothetical protein